MENSEENKNKIPKKDLDSKEGLNDFFSDLDDDDDAIDGDYDEIDQMIDEVMALLEKYGNFSGGIITFDTIFEFLLERNYPTLKKSDCFEIIARLRTNQVLLDEIVYEDLPDFYLYVFKDLKISPNGIQLLKIFAQTPLLPFLTLQSLKEKSELDDSVFMATIEELQNQKLIYSENAQFSCLGISNKK
ncbi:MAG: hypothetical protein E4G98_01755 [Promethearchaeota archaeon]|nr:MAG: hypothetical protein E4G98_01755 [Candidatus Lokiarchaeota archaeon]